MKRIVYHITFIFIIVSSQQSIGVSEYRRTYIYMYIYWERICWPLFEVSIKQIVWRHVLPTKEGKSEPPDVLRIVGQAHIFKIQTVLKKYTTMEATYSWCCVKNVIVWSFDSAIREINA